MDVIRLKTPNNTQQLIFWDLKDNFVIYRVIKSLLVGSAQFCTLCHLFHWWHYWSLLYCNLLMWHVLMIDHYCSSYILEMSTLLCVCSVTCDVRRCVPGVRAQPADRQCSDPSNTPHRLSDFDFGCPDAHVVTWHGCFRVTRVKQNCCLIVSMQFRFCRGHNQRTQS